ncbi:MAG: phosphotransferase [Patescibacteria group bacterium]
MIKGTTATKRRHRERARRVIRELHRGERFIPIKKIKFGSRYYIAVGKKDGQQALFKTSIYPRSCDHLTNQKFAREILFLRYINSSPHKLLRQSAPLILSSEIGPRAWYIREYVGGKPQNINGGNIRFVPSFFTEDRQRWLLNLLRELHSIREKDLPSNFKRLLYAPQTLNYLWQFIGPNLPLVESFIRWPNAGLLIRREFKRYGPVYRTTRRVLAHQELYAPHMLEAGGRPKIIDWENVGWASIMKDVVTVWMRASRHSAWQRSLHSKFKRQYRGFKNFDELWNATVFVQAVFNVIGFNYYPDKRDFRELARFSGVTLTAMLKKRYRKP